MNLGQALKDLRLKNALSQADAADKIGITQAYLSRVETGGKEPSTSLIKTMGDFYKVPLSVILWKATEDIDVPENKREAFNVLKPLVDSLVSQII